MLIATGARRYAEIRHFFMLDFGTRKKNGPAV